MDNDNFFVQRGRDLYKTCTFYSKYWNYHLLSPQQGSDVICDALKQGAPFFAGRCGATEMRTCAEYLAGGGERGQAVRFSARAKADIRSLSGVFPATDELLSRFCRAYLADAATLDLMAVWDVGAEHTVARRNRGRAQFCWMRALEPYYFERPWSAALAGKKVLVVHPFVRTIARQYARREELFQNPQVLPQFASLTTVQAVQGLAGQETGFADWFCALDSMKAQIAAADFEVAILGAGAYGLPLAAYVKSLGRQAIQMNGATQILFGIKGRRWDDHPIISKLYNEAWVRPGRDEGLQNGRADTVEGGSYW